MERRFRGEPEEPARNWNRGTHHSFRSRPLRVSPETEAEVSKQIDEMLENGIIRPSSSSWASRVILVKKKDGTHRFAVDYRDLNDVTKRDAYPMPDSRDVFDRMGGAAVFSTLDGASAYWRVPVKEKHWEFTAFVSTRGQFEFNRMPFGLSNSQATYQRAVDQGPYSLRKLKICLTLYNFI